MEKNLENKLHGKFLDSMNYVQKVASDNKEDRTLDMSDFYDEMVEMIPNSDYLESGLNHFLDKKESGEDRFYAIGLLLDYAKNRMPEIDLFDYVLKASKQCYGEKLNGTPLRDRN